MNYTFEYSGIFRRNWAAMELDDDDLRLLELTLLAFPERGKVIPHSGGARKVRFAPAESGEGKRGGVRICYAVFPEYRTISVVTAYTKRKKSNLTPGELTQIRAYLDYSRRQLSGEVQ